MQSSTVPTSEVLGPSGVGRSPSAGRERRFFAVIGLGGAAVAATIGAVPRMPSPSLRTAMGEAAVLMATLTAGGVLASLARARGAWVGTRLAAGGLGASVLFQIGWWVARSVGHGLPNGQLFAGTTTLLLLTFLASLTVDFFEHIQEGRAELLSDIVLVSTLAGVAVFVLMHEEALGQPSVWGFALTALIAASAILVVVGWGVLALWCPSSVHLALFACATALGSSALALDDTRHFGTGMHSLVGSEVLAAIAVLAL